MRTETLSGWHLRPTALTWLICLTRISRYIPLRLNRCPTRFLPCIRRCCRVCRCALCWQTIPARAARYADFPEDMDARLKAALNRPERYAAGAGLSSVCDLAWIRHERNPIFDAAFGPDYVPAPPNDLFAAAERVAALPPEQRPALFQYCGVEDFLWKDNLRLRDHLRALGLSLHWEEGPGGHSWTNWDERIRHVLAWLPLSENTAKTGSIGV